MQAVGIGEGVKEEKVLETSVGETLTIRLWEDRTRGEIYVPSYDPEALVFPFGDPVYEPIRVYAGRPFRFTEHLDRLEQSARSVAIPVPYTRERWTALVSEAVSRSAYPEAKVYIQITRGAAPRDHVLASHVPPTVVITVRALVPPDPALYASGVDVVTVPDIRWA